MLLFQQMSGWLNSPRKMKACKREASWSWRFVGRLPLIRWPVVDHKVPFVASVSDSYSQAFDLLMATLQGQLSTLN